MRGVTTFGRSDRYGRVYRHNDYNSRPSYRYNPSRVPNPGHNVQNRRFGSLPPSRSNVNIQRQSRSSGTFGNGSRLGTSSTRSFGGHR